MAVEDVIVDSEETVAEVANLLTPEKDEKEAEKPEFTAKEAGVSEEESGDAETVEGEESSEDDIWDMKALAEEAGMSIEDLYTTPVRLGEAKEPTTLGEMKDFYAKYQPASKQVQEKLSSLDQVRQQAQAAQAAMVEYGPQIQDALTKIQTLEKEAAAVDWNNVPEGQENQYQQYAQHLNTQWQMAKAQHDTAKAMIENSEVQLQAVTQAEEQARHEEWTLKAQEEWPKIFADNGWKDEAEAQQGMQRLYAQFERYGMTPDEAHKINDSRLFKMAADAMRMEEASKIKPKKVKPKKPVASRKVPASIKRKREKEAALRRAKSGSEQDQIAEIAKLMNMN